MHTFVVVIVQQFLSSDHVEKLEHTASFNVIGSLRSQATDRSNTNVEVSDLCGTNARLGDLELLASNIHAVESVKSSLVGGVGILIFGKSDTLNNLVRIVKKLTNFSTHSGFIRSSILDKHKRLGLSLPVNRKTFRHPARAVLHVKDAAARRPPPL